MILAPTATILLGPGTTPLQAAVESEATPFSGASDVEVDGTAEAATMKLPE
jgi:hypothetical protein